MKLKRALLSVLAASLLPFAGATIALVPAASAQVVEVGYAGLGRTPDDAAYTVTTRASGHSIQAAHMDYPWRAVKNGREGSCTLDVAVGPDGRVSSTSVATCSSWIFKRQAMEIGRSLRFVDAPPAGQARVDISWTIGAKDAPATSLASLR